MEQKLINCIDDNNVEKFSELLSEFPNDLEQNRLTYALEVASFKGRLEMVELMMNKQWWNPKNAIIYAAWGNQISILNYLLDLDHPCVTTTALERAKLRAEENNYFDIIKRINEFLFSE